MYKAVPVKEELYVLKFTSIEKQLYFENWSPLTATTTPQFFGPLCSSLNDLREAGLTLVKVTAFIIILHVLLKLLFQNAIFRIKDPQYRACLNCLTTNYKHWLFTVWLLFFSSLSFPFSIPPVSPPLCLNFLLL